MNCWATGSSRSVLDIARDWTWEGFASPALTLTRDGATIATMLYPGVIAQSALGTVAATADRTQTRIVLLDAISTQPAPGTYPAVLNPHYGVIASFPSAPPLVQTYTTLMLPITTPPAQTPKIVATGIAESPYVAAADYSSTQLRDRYLWIEFDAPIADTGDDTYFGRVLAYGADPLLAGALLPSHVTPNTIPEPPLPIDPEPVRLIFAGEDSDQNGLDAMTQLIAANSSGSSADKVHFLLPLPPDLTSDALQLFGFWTYEFRVGHLTKWSTAQGRFGRPLRVAGVQHPPPPLTCTVWRNDSVLTVTAPYATTLLNGVAATSLAYGDPQTALWFMLYTQVTQTDGASNRNILLGRQLGHVMTVTTPGVFPAPAGKPGTARVCNLRAVADRRAIEPAWSLPPTAPLSVLAVEILPGPLHGGSVLAGTTTLDVEVADPLGVQLGQRRILRTSPLIAAPVIC